MKIVKKFLQNIFKKFFQFIFKIVYGEVIYIENNLNHKNILVNKIQNQNIKKYDNGHYHAVIMNFKNVPQSNSCYQLVQYGTSWNQLVPAGTSGQQLVTAGNSWYSLA